MEGNNEPSAEIGIELEVVCGGTWKPLVKENFCSNIANTKRKNFRKLASMDPKEATIQDCGVAQKVGFLVWHVAGYVNEVVQSLPFEAMIIGLDEENGAVMINAGSKQGAKIRDKFSVYSLDSSFIDSVTQQSLGEKWVKQGVVKIKVVNEHFAEATIIAGGDLKKENWVKPKNSNLLSTKKKPWWQFYTLESLP
jgi:hypothetical protein